MQGLGTINNEYTILSIKYSESKRISYLAKHNQTEILRIIEFAKDNHHQDDFPTNEINLLNVLNNTNNPYILRYIGNGQGQLALNGEQPKDVPYIIFENAPKFDLFSYNQHGRFSERQAKLIFKKILNGVKAIHNANYCHLDIKPSNILFDEHYNPKIYGFYFCRLNSNQLVHQMGSKNYMAPEILENQTYDGFKCDIFSLGQLLFNLVCGLNGFQSAKKHDKYYNLIIEKNYVQYWNSEAFSELNLSQDFKDLVVRMLAFDPNERPTIDEILQSTWMQGINNQIEAVEQEVSNELHQRDATLQHQLQLNA